MGVSRADNRQKLTKFAHKQSQTNLHNINAHTKFSENPLMFTQVIIRKRKMDGQTDVRRTDGLADNQRETIIPHHYCVAGYKKACRYCLGCMPLVPVPCMLRLTDPDSFFDLSKSLIILPVNYFCPLPIDGMVNFRDMVCDYTFVKTCFR